MCRTCSSWEQQPFRRTQATTRPEPSARWPTGQPRRFARFICRIPGRSCMPERVSQLVTAVVAGLLATACASHPAAGDNLAADNLPAEHDFVLIDRGRYLTTVADCVACHTDPDSNALFAGGRPIETPFGKVVSANITPDLETGIGSWTDAQFDAAV